MCDTNQTLVWNFCIEKKCFAEMVTVGARMTRKIYGTVVMILYNCFCRCNEEDGAIHKGRVDQILCQQNNGAKNTILSSILIHAITEQEDDPGFVWVEILFETILEGGMFGIALNSVKPSTESPVKISMEQRILLSFLSRSCGVGTIDYAPEVNEEMLGRITRNDVNTLINMLQNLIITKDDDSANKSNGNAVNIDEQSHRMEVWRSFLIDTITITMSIFADLVVQGSDMAKETIANDTKILKFVINYI